MSKEKSTVSGNQSLFNIYYLGKTRVDRRCDSSMMPWIIEELKLKAGEMKFIWLSPGREGVLPLEGSLSYAGVPVLRGPCLMLGPLSYIAYHLELN